MKKQKGISFIEINVSIVLFLIVAVCIIGMLANCTLWVRKTTELRQCIHLAQWKMAETQYMSESDIREGSDNFPAPFNNYEWQIQKLTPADPRLEGFTEIKVTAIGLTGTKHSLVILKKAGPPTRNGDILYVKQRVLGNGYQYAIFKINISDTTREIQLIPWTPLVSATNIASQVIKQAKYSRDGEYIFYWADYDKIYRIPALGDPDGTKRKLIVSRVADWFDVSPREDEIVYPTFYQPWPGYYTVAIKKINYLQETPTPSELIGISWGTSMWRRGGVLYPVYSPNGDKIAICKGTNWPAFKGNIEIGLINPDGTGCTKIFTKSANSTANYMYIPRYINFNKPAWSPDSTKISFSYKEVSYILSPPLDPFAQGMLYVQNLNSGATKYLTYQRASSLFSNDIAKWNCKASTYPAVWINNDRIAFTVHGDNPLSGLSGYVLPSSPDNQNCYLRVNEPFSAQAGNNGLKIFNKTLISPLYGVDSWTFHFSRTAGQGIVTTVSLSMNTDFIGYHRKSNQIVIQNSGSSSVSPSFCVVDAGGTTGVTQISTTISGESMWVQDIYNGE